VPTSTIFALNMSTICMTSALVVESTPTLMRASSLFTESSGVYRSPYTSMSLLSCFSPAQNTVISAHDYGHARDVRILSNANCKAFNVETRLENSPATLVRTPGLFSTSTATYVSYVSLQVQYFIDSRSCQEPSGRRFPALHNKIDNSGSF